MAATCRRSNPTFTAGGDLLFAADVSGWWAPQRVGSSGAEPVLAEPVEAEIGGAAWVHGLRWLAPLADGRIACTVTEGGFDRLGVVDRDGMLTVVDTPFNDIRQVVAGPEGDEVLVVAGSVTTGPGPYRVTIGSGQVGDWCRRTTRSIRHGVDGEADQLPHVGRANRPRPLLPPGQW